MSNLQRLSVTCHLFFFFFNDTATTEIYTLSLHDALPISCGRRRWAGIAIACARWKTSSRSEEHTSELQSQSNLVCRLLLEKKKKPDIKPCITANRTSRNTSTTACLIGSCGHPAQLRSACV